MVAVGPWTGTEASSPESQVTRFDFPVSFPILVAVEDR